MRVKAAQLAERIALEVRDLPEERMQEVLDFVEFLKRKWEKERRPPRGSPEAILKHAGVWQFEPGELDKILTDIEQMRDMELEKEAGVEENG